MLRPSIKSLVQRDAARRAATGKVAYGPSFTPGDNDRHLAGTDRSLGLWVDTTDQTLQQTLDEVLARAEESLVRRG